MRVRESKLVQFIRLGGYEIVRQIKQGSSKGHWRNLSEASRKTGISRPTIYKILKNFPVKPCEVKTKYVDKLEESEGMKQLVQMFENTLTKNTWNVTVTTIKTAFKILGYKKDPVVWTEQDYRILWAAPKFHSDECKGIEKRFAVSLRRLMRATDKPNLLTKFRYNNPPDGKRKQWFLHTKEIERLIPHIQEVDTLLFFFTGIACGARSSAIEEIRAKDLDTTDNILQVYEEKVKHYVLKFPPTPLIDLLAQYINNYRIAPEERLFKKSYDSYRKRLKKAGKKAQLTKNITTHIMKHTFVTQANRHGVSAETIVHQTGTELRCLEKFYRATNESKLRNEMQGTTYKTKPFHEWIRKLGLCFKIKYNELKK